jgi:ABC-2 type transport system ATP-binding protein
VLAGDSEGEAIAEVAISTEGLVKDYGGTRALAGLDLDVRTGEVYGFLGPNGAGKTTTIRLLLDLIRPTDGRATVLGLDPRMDGVALRRRIGYLAGDFVVSGRQTGRELLTYLGNLRGGVARSRIDDLAQRLGLDLSLKIKTLSRGNRQKVGVVQAFMHDPELLVLDEPTSGLDPFLQHEFAAMAREATAEGRTVFMSSHVMSEVQLTADRVGIIREGQLVAVERVEDLRERSMRRIEIRFDGPVPTTEFAGLAGVSELAVDGAVLRCRLDGRADALVKAAARHSVVTLSVEEADLEELFFHYYDQRREPGDVA